jgi:hypothetical protein
VTVLRQAGEEKNGTIFMSKAIDSKTTISSLTTAVGPLKSKNNERNNKYKSDIFDYKSHTYGKCVQADRRMLFRSSPSAPKEPGPEETKRPEGFSKPLSFTQLSQIVVSYLNFLDISLLSLVRNENPYRFGEAEFEKFSEDSAQYKKIAAELTKIWTVQGYDIELWTAFFYDPWQEMFKVLQSYRQELETINQSLSSCLERYQKADVLLSQSLELCSELYQGNQRLKMSLNLQQPERAPSISVESQLFLIGGLTTTAGVLATVAGVPWAVPLTSAAVGATWRMFQMISRKPPETLKEAGEHVAGLAGAAFVGGLAGVGISRLVDNPVASWLIKIGLATYISWESYGVFTSNEYPMINAKKQPSKS